ncbi:MAG: hypothetical protein AAF403_03960, partial [Pseudomonadota bacterium]
EGGLHVEHGGLLEGRSFCLTKEEVENYKNSALANFESTVEPSAFDEKSNVVPGPHYLATKTNASKESSSQSQNEQAQAEGRDKSSKVEQK